MVDYYEYFYYHGLYFKIAVDNDKLILGLDWIGDPLIYDYWGNMECFIDEL